MPKTALITGVTGQDGAYLGKLLLERGYTVVGAFRHNSAPNMWRLSEMGIVGDIRLVPMDLLEFSNVQRVVDSVAPDEVYNLAAQSFVEFSFNAPIYTSEVNAL